MTKFDFFALMVSLLALSQLQTLFSSLLTTVSRVFRSFSLFHNNVRSLKRNFESLETQLLNELEYHFSVIGITETKLANSDLPEQLPSLPGYEFEFVPSPLSAGGVGMFISDKKHTDLEKLKT